MPNPNERNKLRARKNNERISGGGGGGVKRVPSSSNTAYEDMHVASIIHFASNRIHNSLLF